MAFLFTYSLPDYEPKTIWRRLEANENKQRMLGSIVASTIVIYHHFPSVGAMCGNAMVSGGLWFLFTLFLLLRLSLLHLQNQKQCFVLGSSTYVLRAYKVATTALKPVLVMWNRSAHSLLLIPLAAVFQRWWAHKNDRWEDLV